MNIQELRIGNLVKWKHGEDEYNTVHSIDPEQIDLGIITPFGVHPEDIEGIPLTEEWLLRLGYEEYFGTRNFYIDHKRFHIYAPRINKDFLFCTESDVVSRQIKYVHQLQNLFYSLEGDELTLNIDL